MLSKRVNMQDEIDLICREVSFIGRRHLGMTALRAPSFVLMDSDPIRDLSPPAFGQPRLVYLAVGLPADVLARWVAKEFAYWHLDGGVLPYSLREAGSDWAAAQILYALAASGEAHGLLDDGVSRNPEGMRIVLEIQQRAGDYQTLRTLLEERGSPLVNAIRVYRHPGEISMDGEIIPAFSGRHAPRRLRQHRSRNLRHVA